MPVPAQHIRELSILIGNHRAKIAELRKELQKRLPPARDKQLRNELRKHEVAVDLGTDPQLIPALNELLDDPRARAIAMANPTAYARQKRVRIPAGATVTIQEFSAFVKIRVRVEVSFEIAGIKVTVGYDSETGWYGSIDKA